MQLRGHSNFNLKLIKNKKGYFVEKSDGKRLHQQCEKQEVYYDLINNEPILSHLFEVPKIQSGNWKDNRFSFIMKFYNGKSILDILEKGDITLLDDLINKLFLYLKWEFDNSIEEFPYDDIQNKLINLGTKVEYSIFKNIVINLLDKVNLNQQPIPIGYCHGDFTFNNMIFSHKIILIDWLDSFVESPIQDCAKILQEVNLQWTLLIDGGKGRDITKIKIGYEYLRWQIIQRIINEYHQYLKLIDLFYAITLLRIIPYTTNKIIYDIVVQKLEKMKL